MRIAASLTGGKPVDKAVTRPTVGVTKENLNTPEGQKGVYKISC